jgi:hypothetical protein
MTNRFDPSIIFYTEAMNIRHELLLLKLFSNCTSLLHVCNNEDEFYKRVARPPNYKVLIENHSFAQYFLADKEKIPINSNDGVLYTVSSDTINLLQIKYSS